MKTDATTVPEYLATLAEPRRAAVALVCDRLGAAPEVDETFQHGMPFFTRGDEPFIAVASQKHYVSLYVVSLDETLPAQPDLEAALTGINRGKNCLRLRDTQLARIDSATIDELIAVTAAWRDARGR